MKAITVEKHFLFCGGVKPEPRQGKRYELQLGKGDGMIHLDTKKIVKTMVKQLTPVLHDLLEIATYVYAGDQYISRGGSQSFDYGNKWHRQLHYIIPVCEHHVWNRDDVKKLLEESLSFAAGETYHFEFIKRPERDRPDYLTFDDTEETATNYEKIVMFSGGLDSFSGALEEIISGKRVCMVSHFSNRKVVKLQRDLHTYLCDLQKANDGPKPLHVTVEINKHKDMSREESQRTRSFLFAVLGAIIASYENLSEVSFFENGIVSCNLPWDGQTLQARATRTTHPKFLGLLSLLVTELLEKDFSFINPYFELTKTEVIDRIVKNHQQKQIQKTRSCAEAFYQNPQTHCGLCSQCIDRRFATLAAQCLEHDPWVIYKTNIFTDELTVTEDKTMAIGFAAFALWAEDSAPDSFLREFPSEIAEIVAHYRPDDKKAGLKILHSLHQRYALQVNDVLSNMIAEHKRDFPKGLLPDACLLQMVAMKEHLKWRLDRYHRKTAVKQVMEVKWEKDNPEYMPNSLAVKITDGKISLATLSKLLKPNGTIRYMRSGRRCKVHFHDFCSYAKTVHEEITDEAIENYLNGVERRKAQIRATKKK